MDEQNTPQSQSSLASEFDPIRFAEMWNSLSSSEKRSRFIELPRTDGEEFFLSLKTHDQGILLEDLTPMETRSWIRLLAPDDVADLIQEMGLDKKEDLLLLLDPQTRREVTALLAYAEDEAGGLMSSRFVRLRPDMSVDEAISYIRIQAKTQVETIYYAYVLSNDQKLVGVVSFRELFAAGPGKKITEFMHTDVVKIPVEMDQEQIGQIFAQQDLMAVPVVDTEGRMQGIVTFDDIASAVQDEATEDIHKMGAVETLDAPYLQISLGEMIKKRGMWLLILFAGEMLTASAMDHYQVALEKALVLTLFIPLIISSGGNSGSQATTLIIRAMALGEVRLRDWARVLRRELISGLILGFCLGTVGFLKIVLWPGRVETYGPHYVLIGATVFISLIGIVMWGTISGSMLPFLLKKLGLDPASASAPAVATIVDVTGLVIYFTTASLLLTGTLL